MSWIRFRWALLLVFLVPVLDLVVEARAPVLGNDLALVERLGFRAGHGPVALGGDGLPAKRRQSCVFECRIYGLTRLVAGPAQRQAHLVA